jgi:hypothetical protein
MDPTPDPMALFVLAFFALGWFLYAVMLHRICCERDRLREQVDQLIYERDHNLFTPDRSRQTPCGGCDLSIYDEYRQQREGKLP